ncbi:hypothetical protein BH23VER1_BH23VER1_07970 [soil metagenome]
MRLRAEVAGRFEEAGDASKLLYAPLDSPLQFRRTRVYEMEFEGDAGAAERFMRRVLVDDISQDVTLDGDPVFGGEALFYLDYGMKPGALDLEKETVLGFWHELADPGFTVGRFTIRQRIYLFGESAGAVPVARFVRDIVNPAIHVWESSAPSP